MKQINTILVLLLGISISLIISGCGPVDDKTRIQQEIDAKNSKNNRAFCVRVGKAYYHNENYPFSHDAYHINVKDEEKKSDYFLEQVNAKNEDQLKFALFAKAKLFTEEIFNHYNHYYEEKITYVYRLTGKGEKHFDSWGGTSLCFGRIVVDEVFDTTAKQSNEDGEQFKVISFSYHLSGIPDWMQDKDIQGLYTSHTDFINLVLGKKVTGQHRYKVAEDGSLTLWDGIRGNRYIL